MVQFWLKKSNFFGLKFTLFDSKFELASKETGYYLPQLIENCSLPYIDIHFSSWDRGIRSMITTACD